MKRTILAAAILFSAVLIVAPTHAEEMKTEVLVPNALDLTGPQIPIEECKPLEWYCNPFQVQKPGFCACLHDEDMGEIEQFIQNMKCRYASAPEEFDVDAKIPPDLMEKMTEVWQEIIRNAPKTPVPDPKTAKALSKILRQVCQLFY